MTYICPGVEKRAKGLTFDEVLGDEAPALWAGELSQVSLQGTRVMREVAFFHHASKTLILVDLVENVTAATPGTNWFLRLLVSDDRDVEHAQPGARVPAWLG